MDGKRLFVAALIQNFRWGVLMRRFMVSILVAGSLIAAASAQAALPTSSTPAVERMPAAQVAGYWGYAQCVIENRVEAQWPFVYSWTFLTPVMIGMAIGCM
jgi:hypothetical protein